MKPSKYLWFGLISFSVAGLVLLSNSACKKSPPKDLSASLPPGASLSTEAAKQQRLEWNLTTLVEAYEQSGHSNPKWDEPAKRALTEFARNRAKIPGSQPEVIATNVATAIHAGCDDPMVNYLFIKYSMAQTNSKEAFTAAFYKMALAMEASSYPPVRKFYAGLRTTEQFGWANNWSTNWPVEMSALEHRTTDHLSAVLKDPKTPASEIYDACHDYLNDWEKDKETYPKIWESMEPLVFKYWPNDSSSWLLKGEADIRMAWLARSDDTAGKVTEEGWKLFSKHLTTAQEALEHAWEMNPQDVRIPIQMMTVMLGQGGGRERMESWFDRAMKLDPNNYDACHNKLNYLAPKWYGSYEDMLQFGRECVQNKKWGGQVPLALVDVHVWIQTCPDCLDKSEQATYWKRPDVWNDIQAAYDRFFEVNPDATSYYNNYVLYAYKAEQWDKLNELIPKLDPVNYDFFGGTNEFDKMVQIAKEHASKPK